MTVEMSRMIEPDGLVPGVHELEDGTVHVAHLTWFPGGRGEMLEWWFGYMSDFEDYRRWHPTDHLAFEWVEGWEPGRFVGATHLTHETLGGGPLLMKAHIQFVPRALHLDWRRFAELRVGGAVCGRAMPLADDGSVGPEIARLCHVGLDREGGFECRSAFWIHGAGEAAREIAPGILEHSTEEMAILATFLPELYAQETGPTRA